MPAWQTFPSAFLHTAAGGEEHGQESDTALYTPCPLSIAWALHGQIQALPSAFRAGRALPLLHSVHSLKVIPKRSSHI